MSYQDDDTPAVVIDNGSDTIKAGFAGEDVPREVFPTVIGAPHNTKCIFGKHSSIGHSAQIEGSNLSLRYPIQRGTITNWDDMENIWNHTFYKELRVAPEEHPVLMTETPLNPKPNRELMTQIMFEKYSVPSFYLNIPALLSLYSVGRTTGIVFDSGDGVSCAVPIYDGYVLHYAIEKVNFAGDDLTAYLGKLIQERGYNITSFSNFRTLRDVKEKMCFTALDYEKEIRSMEGATSSNHEMPYKLPDGQVITIGNERFLCGEALFKPSFVGVESVGAHELVYNSIMKSDIELRPDFVYNVLLSGGSALFPGFDERMGKELNYLVDGKKMVKVRRNDDKKNSAWLGGSIQASLPTFSSLSVSKQEYDEFGPSVVHKKCF